MSLSTREQHALHSIEDGLADSDPGLTSLLATFTKLTDGEEFPERENIHARLPGRLHGKLVWALLCFVVSAALIGAGVSLSRGGGRGQGECSTWLVPAPCTVSAPAPAHSAQYPRGLTGPG